MTIHLSEDRELFIRSLIEAGRFASEDEVIDEAFRLLVERDEEARLTVLRQEIAIGIDQADRGELAPFDPHGTLARIRSRQSPATKVTS
jgi:antitoxin ParD1/3/4